MTRTQFLAELRTHNTGPQFPLVFIAKQYFFIVLRHRSWGGPFGEPQKLIF